MGLRKIVKIFLLLMIGLLSIETSSVILHAESSSESPHKNTKSKTLYFGIDAWKRPTYVIGAIRPILTLIENHTEKEKLYPIQIRTHMFQTPEEVANQLTQGNLDFARLDPVIFYKYYKNEPLLKIIAMETYEDETSYPMMILASSGSAVDKIEDIKGRKIAFGRKNTVTNVMGEWLLLNKLIQITDFSDVSSFDSDEQVARAVAENRFDIGFVTEDTLIDTTEEGLALKKIETFKIPTHVWVARPGLPEEIIAAIRRNLLTEEVGAKMHGLNRDGLKEVQIEDLASVNEALKIGSLVHNEKMLK